MTLTVSQNFFWHKKSTCISMQKKIKRLEMEKFMNTKPKINKYKNIFLLCTFCALVQIKCYGYWDPIETFLDENVTVLNDSNYSELKTKTVDFLKGSWCSEEKTNLLIDLVAIFRPNVCVEIGAWEGGSVIPIAQTLKYLGSGKVFAVDAWSNEWAVKYLVQDEPNKNWWKTVNMKAVHDLFSSRISHLDLSKFCIEIHKPSVEAADLLTEIDFLHLDGDFSETGSKHDIELFLPKVKQGGYILISNVQMCIEGQFPKSEAFNDLLRSCEMIAAIDHDNAILF